jgi:hypothetical protein
VYFKFLISFSVFARSYAEIISSFPDGAGYSEAISEKPFDGLSSSIDEVTSVSVGIPLMYRTIVLPIGLHPIRNKGTSENFSKFYSQPLRDDFTRKIRLKTVGYQQSCGRYHAGSW